MEKWMADSKAGRTKDGKEIRKKYGHLEFHSMNSNRFYKNQKAPFL